MIPLQRKWGIYLCRCSLPDGFAVEALEVGEPVLAVAQGVADLPAFVARLRKGFVEQVLFACECTEPEQLEQACDAVGIAPEIHPLALGGGTAAAPEPGEAAARALRMVRGTMAGFDASPSMTQNLLTVGPRVALFSDRPEGLALATQLQPASSLVVFLEGDAQGFGEQTRGVNWGRPEAVAGRLGELEITVAPVEGSDFSTPQRVTADQVVVVGQAAAHMRGRTGVHCLPEPQPEQLAAVAAAIAELTGTFAKPEHVRYDAALCAGGAAERQACGRCIPACPYDAIQRDSALPLRVKVDHLSCEGCGACASACPTSALRFTDPAPESLYARIAALLAPAGDTDAPAPAVLFHCEQQGREQLRWAAREQAHLPTRLLPVEVPCLRYVSESAMLAALRMGAAGVGLLGCEDCPNGERTLLLEKLELAQRILGAFELGEHRVRLLTVDPAQRADAQHALETFAASLGPPPVPPDGKRFRATGNREALGEAIRGFIGATGREIGGIKVGPEQPFALAAVNDEGCTLCRACATVCPTHAFAFDMEAQTLRFKHIECVNCGLCAGVCPERVITLRHELYLESASLDYVTVAQDEMVRCARCDKPYINRRALETVQARLREAEGVVDTFTGQRATLLEMCPDCRAAAAMLEVERGWAP